MKHIYAKSNPSQTLFKHTEECLKVFKSIKSCYYNEHGVLNDEFFETLFISIFLHDMGKIASGFQNMLRTGEKWNFRHEALSILFAKSFPDHNTIEIILTILYHHKNQNYIKEKYDFRRVETEDYNEKFEQLKPNLYYVNYMFSKLASLSKKYLGKEINITKYKIENIENIDKVFDNCFDEYSEQRYIYLKGCMTACDHLASAGYKKINKGIKNLNRKFKFKLNSIQKQCHKTSNSSFLIAPTSSGKTESSLLWADANQSHDKAKRIFYVLPFRASLNAMYIRFEKLFPDNVSLLHSSANYFLYQQNPKTLKHNKAVMKKIRNQYKVLTQYQIIKDFFNVRGYEQRLFEMTGALFIFDEIHTYDIRSMALMMKIMEVLKFSYNAKFLIMTATLPQFIKTMFEQALDIKNDISFNNNELKAFNRHIINTVDLNISEGLELIVEEINNGKRVLVVCNQVNTAQNIYMALRDVVENSRLLHSRFILRDRENIEKNIKNYDLLVSTQVIEVSIDIDYDVLFTELAPVDALIQRAGRINRKRPEQIREMKSINIFTTISSGDEYVYDINILNRTRTCFNLINGNVIDETTVQELVDTVYPGFTDAQQLEFNTIYNSFSRIVDDIKAFDDSSRTEEFYEMFDSYEVVPMMFRDEFIELIKDKQFLMSSRLVLNISKANYNRLRKSNNVRIEPINERNYIFINTDYNSEIGMLLH